ncbi:spermidine synthase [soil metagenome]
MIPFRNLAEARTPDGSRISLHEHDGDYFIKLDGRQLMSSTSTASELMLADKACAPFGRQANMRVLIGGLGLGFSLKRVLELMGKDGSAHVAELLPEVVAWNRELLAPVNGKLLQDSRVDVFVEDVFAVIRRGGKQEYHAILLDVDNGPTSLVQSRNSRLYTRRGLRSIHDALKPGGRVAFWSAEKEPAFRDQLAGHGFATEEYPAKAHERAKRFAHMIYVGERR